MMLAKEQISLAILSLLVTSVSAVVDCNGTELSVRSDSEVGLLTEKSCTHVFGDIYISNLNGGKRMPSYWSIEEIYGSLIITNTTDLGDSVNLQNVRIIHALNGPAIKLTYNTNLKLAIGASLGDVKSEFGILYYFIGNWPAFMSESQQYTLNKASHKMRPVVFTDMHFLTKPCDELYYYLWIIVFTFLSFVVSAALSAVSFYGRPLKEKPCKITVSE